MLLVVWWFNKVRSPGNQGYPIWNSNGLVELKFVGCSDIFLPTGGQNIRNLLDYLELRPESPGRLAGSAACGPGNGLMR